MKYIFSFFLLLFISCDRNKPTTHIEQPKSGYEIYNERCTSCHGMDGTLGFANAKNLTKTNKSIDEMILQITNGKGAMTPFKNLLSPAEIDSVAHYVSTFKK